MAVNRRGGKPEPESDSSETGDAASASSSDETNSTPEPQQRGRTSSADRKKAANKSGSKSRFFKRASANEVKDDSSDEDQPRPRFTRGSSAASRGKQAAKSDGETTDASAKQRRKTKFVTPSGKMLLPETDDEGRKKPIKRTRTKTAIAAGSGTDTESEYYTSETEGTSGYSTGGEHKKAGKRRRSTRLGFGTAKRPARTDLTARLRAGAGLQAIKRTRGARVGDVTYEDEGKKKKKKKDDLEKYPEDKIFLDQSHGMVFKGPAPPYGQLAIQFPRSDHKTKAIKQWHIPEDGSFQDEEKEEFSFKNLIEQDKAEEIHASDSSESDPEKDDGLLGIYAQDFNEKEFEKKRQEAEGRTFVPRAFRVKRLRPIEEIAPEAQIHSMKEFVKADSKGDPLRIQYLGIEGPFEKKEAKKNRKLILKSLHKFTNVEILVLRNIGIEEMSKKIALPNLLYLNISKNNIKTANKVTAFIRNSPLVQDIDTDKNPFVGKPDWDLEIIAAAPMLHKLNRKRTVTIHDRMNAVKTYGLGLEKKEVPDLWFQHVMGTLDSIRHMTSSWDPTLVRELEISKRDLSELSLGSLVNLVKLKASNNNIRHLIGTGIEKCSDLIYLDLSSNIIREQKELDVLGMCPSLDQVILTGNNIDDHRRYLLFATSHLKGRNKAPGLHSIDGVEVKLEERVDAQKKYGKLKKHDVDTLRWRLATIAIYGHRAVQNDEFSPQKMIMRSCGLEETFLKEHRELSVLDLSGNDLRLLPGLSKLKGLRKLNLADNPKLDVEDCVGQLKKLNNLERIWFADAGTPSPKTRHGHGGLSYRVWVLSEVLFLNRSLHMLDGTLIDVKERVSAYAATKPGRKEVEVYRYNLAVTVSATQPQGRLYHPEEVAIGDQYDPYEVRDLLHLDNIDLREEYIDLQPFARLQKLNISYNNITDILSIGLEACKNLRELDASFNQITNDPSDVGKMMEGLKLVSVAFRGNPFMKKQGRVHLMDALPSLHRHDCSLKVIDVEITLHERVEAYHRAGGNPKEVEAFKTKAALNMRAENAEVAEMDALDLSFLDVRTLNLRSYVNLQSLDLRGNELTSLKDVGIQGLRELRRLDCRYNKLTSLDEIAEVVAPLPHIVSIGFFGNPCAAKEKYRMELFARLPILVHNAQHPLQVIDGQEIDVEDLIAYWDVAFEEAEMFRFKRLEYLRVIKPQDEQGHSVGQISRIGFKGLGLRMIALQSYTSVTLLDLSDNKLDNDSLGEAGFGELQRLVSLNLSNNKIDQVGAICNTVDILQELESIWVLGNPCFSSDEDKERIDFLGGLNQNTLLDAPLKFLNGHEITVGERIKGIKEYQTLSKKDYERFRFMLVVERLYLDPATVVGLQVANQGLRRFDDIVDFKLLEHVVLRDNPLETLEGMGLETIHALKYLDLRNSVSPTLELKSTIAALSKCNNLTHLLLKGCTSETTHSVSSYAFEVFTELRGVSTLDGVVNPNPLTPQQRIAVKWFNVAASLGPNSIRHMDLRGRRFDDTFFGDALGYASTLPVSSLWFNENPWEDQIKNIRYYWIFYLKELKTLNGENVHMDERANAAKFIKELDPFIRRDFFPKNGELRIPQKPTPEQQKQAAAMGAGFVAGTGKFFGSEMEKIARSHNFELASLVVASTGTMIAKTEIFVNFFQIYGLILAFELPEFWPEIYIDVTSWVVLPFTIDVNLAFDLGDVSYKQYLTFFAMMAVPPLLWTIYKTGMNERNWRNNYLKRWPQTRFRAFSIWFLVELAIIAVAIMLNLDENIALISEGNLPTDGTQTVVWIASITPTFLYLVWLIVVLIYRKKQNDVLFFDKIRMWKRRLSLFGLSMMYLPIARLILFNFKEMHVPIAEGSEETVCVLEAFPDEPCVDGVDSWLWIHWLSLAFAAIYAIGIPVFFVVLIRRGVMMVDRLNNVPQELQKIEEAKEELKRQVKDKELTVREAKERKGQIKEMKEEFSEMWGNAVKSFENPQAVLYSSYERPSRFNKVLVMIQKLSLIIVSTVALDQSLEAARFIAGTTVMGLSVAYAAVARPYLDNMEDIMDILSQVTNSVNCVVGIGIADGWLDSDTLKNILLFGFNGLNIGWMVLVVFANPIRTYFAQKNFDRQQASKAASKLKERQEEAKKAAKEAEARQSEAESGADDDDDYDDEDEGPGRV